MKLVGIFKRNDQYQRHVATNVDMSFRRGSTNNKKQFIRAHLITSFYLNNAIVYNFIKNFCILYFRFTYDFSTNNRSSSDV